MKKLLLGCFITFTFLNANAQQAAPTIVDTMVPAADIVFKKPVDDATSTRYKSPYYTSWKQDGPIVLGAIAGTAFGTYLIGKKKELTVSELATKTYDKIPSFDRGNAGYYDEEADDKSYIPFHASFAWPVVMSLVNKNQRQNMFQVMSMYIETMAITGTLFTVSAGTFNRARPLVYTRENGTPGPADIGKRRDKDSQRSFYAGHTAATASASFFTAKVFQDFNPDSKLKPVVWAVAAITPAVVGYYRYKAGMHFLSDNILGYVMGASAGILVPHLHKNNKLTNMSFTPEVGRDYRGMSMTYKF